MFTCSIYDETNGKFEATFSGPEYTVEKQLKENQSFIEGRFRDDQYYFDLVEGVPKEQPQIQPTLSKTTIISDNEDTIIISGLPTDDLNGNPIETDVSIGNVLYKVPDGVIEFSVDAPGPYNITCEAINHRPFNITIEANNEG